MTASSQRGSSGAARSPHVGRGPGADSRHQESGQGKDRPSFLLRHWVLVPLVVGVLVAAAGLVLKTDLFLAAFDLRVLQDVSHLHSGVGNTVALVLHAGLRGLSAVVVLAIVVGAMMALTRSVRNGLTVFILTTGGWAATAAMKVIVGRPRPDQSLLADSLLPGVQGPTSFPSGHAAFAVSLGIAVALVMWRTRWRTPIVVSAVAFAGLVGASRIYLGVHYVSDVVASFALSVAMIVLLTGAFGSFQRYRAGLARIASPEGGGNP